MARRGRLRSKRSSSSGAHGSPSMATSAADHAERSWNFLPSGSETVTCSKGCQVMISIVSWPNEPPFVTVSIAPVPSCEWPASGQVRVLVSPQSTVAHWSPSARRRWSVTERVFRVTMGVGAEAAQGEGGQEGEEHMAGRRGRGPRGIEERRRARGHFTSLRPTTSQLYDTACESAPPAL